MKLITLTPLKKPTKAEIAMPGSKSYTNRALILAVLTKGTVTIRRPLFCDDTQAMIECLQGLGIKIEVSKSLIKVAGSIFDVGNAKRTLNANLSGTTLRFILALLMLIPGETILSGNDGLNKRPIKELVDVLRSLGGEIDYLGVDGYPPVRVRKATLKTPRVVVSGVTSSQYISALLMVAPVLGLTDISVTGVSISRPYIDMTIEAMKKFGVAVEHTNDSQYHISSKQKYRTKEYVVEGDYSSAGYFLAIAVLTKSKITIKNINEKSIQADKKILTILENMGSRITLGKDHVEIVGTGIVPIKADLADCPDLAQTLAVLAAFSAGKSVLTGLQSLKIKETDRLTAITTELEKMGVTVVKTADSLTISGGTPHGAVIDTYGDHRMAMAFSIFGTKIAGVGIRDPEVVSKTFPNFWEILGSLGVGIVEEDQRNIVLIGMRGCGKTTVGKLLAKKINRKFYDVDELIAARSGTSISEVVESRGWKRFREEESIVLERVVGVEGLVIATGGGAILNEKNIKAIKKNGVCVFLKASNSVLGKRAVLTPARPRLTEEATIGLEINKVAKERNPLYTNAADKIIIVDKKSPEQVAVEIIKTLKLK